MRQVHGEFAGMLEGENLQPLYNPEDADKDKDNEEEEANDINQVEENWKKAGEEYWAAALNGNLVIEVRARPGRASQKDMESVRIVASRGALPGNAQSGASCTAGRRREQDLRLHLRENERVKAKGVEKEREIGKEQGRATAK